MVARPLRATPERVGGAIAELRRQGRVVGWRDGVVRGTALVRDMVGGDQSRVRALIVLASVEAGDRVPLGEVEEARRVLGLAPPPTRRGRRPNDDDARRAAAVGDGRDPAERLALAAERVAAAVEAAADAIVQWAAAAAKPPLPAAGDGTDVHHPDTAGAVPASRSGPTAGKAENRKGGGGAPGAAANAGAAPAMPTTVGTARPMPATRGPRVAS